MATLWIREYANIPAVTQTDGIGEGVVSVAQEPGTDQTPVTFSSSAQSAAFGTGTAYIGIIASDAFHYVCGTNPTATTNALKVPADTLIYIGVKPGHKIAAIAAA